LARAFTLGKALIAARLVGSGTQRRRARSRASSESADISRRGCLTTADRWRSQNGALIRS